MQLAAFMGMAYALLSLVFTKQMVGFFQLADAEAHAAAMSYTDCMWVDCIFLYDVDAYRPLYSSG